MYSHHGLGHFWLLGAILAVVPFWQICKRVGYSPWLSLLILLPLVNLVFLYYLGFAEWPAHRAPPGGPASTNPTPG